MGPSRSTPPRRSPRRTKVRGELVSKNDTSPPTIVQLVDGRRVSVDPVLPIDARLRLIAELQRGRVARRQLLGAGIDTNAIVRRLRRGALELLHRGVYGLPNTGDLPLAAETAALLACGERAVLSHHSAATLWGLRPGTARPVHVTIDGERGCPKPGGVTVHRSRMLSPGDGGLCRGLPITSPDRTLLDVAGRLPDRDVERMFDEGLYALRILTVPEIRKVLTRCGRHPGRARLTKVTADHTHSTETDSPPEERLLQLIRAAGLPEPRTQVPLLDYCLDFFWPQLKLAVEVDAYGTHGSPARFEADRRRDARLLAERGIVVIRVTSAAIEGRPFEAIALLARTIGHREAALRS